MIHHVIHGTGEGGAEKVASILAGGGHPRRARLWCLCPAHPDLRKMSADVRSFEIPDDVHTAPGDRIRILRQRVRRLRTLRGTAIVAHDDASHEAAALASATGGLPVARVIHTSLNWTPEDHRRALHLYAPETAIYFCVEKKTFEYARKLGREAVRLAQPIDIDHVGVHRPDAGNPRNTNHRARARRPIILFVGRLEWAKGADVLLQAFAHLPRRLNAELLIAGGGPEYPNLEEMVRKFKLGGSVRFLGHRKNVGRLYQMADLAVLPSRSEGVPLVMLEAMASGTPVIATAVGGNREILRKYRLTDMLVPPENPKELARAIQSVCVSPAKVRSKFGRTAHFVISEHDADRVRTWVVNTIRAALPLLPKPASGRR